VRRRLLAAAVAAAAVVFVPAAPALAHGFGGRIDLPVPKWLFVVGAGLALVISFAGLAVLWRTPRLEGSRPAGPLPGWFQRVATAPAVEVAVRGVSLVVFLAVLLAAAAGSTEPTQNFAVVVTYTWFWVGLAFAHALLGNLWATLSPWDTLARLLTLGEPGRARWHYPRWLGVWPATVALFGFVWMELADPAGASPRPLGIAIGLYTLVTLAAMAAFGREEWNRHGEAFAVYFGLLARMAPLARDGEGRVTRRPPLAGLPSLEPRPGLAPLVFVILGTTTFDGFSRSTIWANAVGGMRQPGRALATTGAMLGFVLLVAALYWVAMGTAASVGGAPWHPLAVRFVHSLVPIAFAYVVAHYFSFLVLEGQYAIALVSDPLAKGWNLFGTANRGVNLALLSVTAIWYVQVVAIVAGHVSGVVLAHDRAIAIFPERVAVRTQYALLSVMVLLSAGALLILSVG
jgi:hypothetical protein